MRSSAAPGTAVHFVDSRARGCGALHSGKVCRNFIEASLERKHLRLMAGTSSRASAFSFICRLAST